MYSKCYLNEIWKDIAGYEGYYQVSNLGRVKSLMHYHHNKVGYMTPHFNNAYLQVHLSKNGKTKMVLLHRLVAEAFIPNPDNLPCVNHKDEDKTNNCVYIDENGNYVPELSNLEWCSYKYNNNYGTIKNRVSKALSKAVLQYDLEDNVLNRWESLMEIQRQNPNWSAGNICNCCNGKNKTAYGYKWKYVA